MGGGGKESKQGAIVGHTFKSKLETDRVNPSCVIFCAHALHWIKPQADFQQCRTSLFEDSGMRKGVNAYAASPSPRPLLQSPHFHSLLTRLSSPWHFT